MGQGQYGRANPIGADDGRVTVSHGDHHGEGVSRGWHEGSDRSRVGGERTTVGLGAVDELEL